MPPSEHAIKLPPVSVKATHIAVAEDFNTTPHLRSPTKTKGAIADQAAGFFTSPICLAISLGEKEKVQDILDRHPDDLFLRGTFGETILHASILFKQPEIAEYLIENYSEKKLPVMFYDAGIKRVRLIDISYGCGLYEGLTSDGTALEWKPYNTRYEGETALHMACKNGMSGVVDLLLEKEACANVIVSGEEFVKPNDWKYPNMYCGNTPLHFAVTQNDSFEIVKALVEKGHANIYSVDLYGNNVFHIMAYYGLKNKTTDYICSKNKADLVSKKHSTGLLGALNKEGMTPAQLGIHFGNVNIIEMLKEPLWTFGEEFAQYQVSLDEICPILHRKRYATHNTSKSILADIVDRWDHDMITHPIFKSIVRVKWDLYVRRYFIRQFLWSFTTVICFTLSILIDSGYQSNAPETIIDSQFGLICIAFCLTFFGIYDVLEDYVSIYQNTKFLPRHLRNKELSFWNTLDERVEYIWYIVRRDFDEDLLTLGFCGCVVAAFSVRVNARTFGWNPDNTLANIHGMGSILGLIRWLVIYITVAIGYSIAFYAQLKNMDYEALNIDLPTDWNTFKGSLLWTIRFLFVMDDFENMRTVATANGNGVEFLINLILQFRIS
ncbi:Transient receptor putative cation channel sub V member 6 [Physocladia obscura]|uniref:Transient receptor putative cation channel sub V member 6 n=1 Tax=Physocladia obscura TaxID=109957 RepID=A0AAD5T5M4_9FUNG|nr:Transient receptor putative cation channel sub V member 6 [Physocladia obscura]